MYTHTSIPIYRYKYSRIHDIYACIHDIYACMLCNKKLPMTGVMTSRFSSNTYTQSYMYIYIYIYMYVYRATHIDR